MRIAIALSACLLIATAATTAQAATPGAVVYGIDVAGGQQGIDWSHWWSEGKRFAGIKATEGTGYANPTFAEQESGAIAAGFVTAAYHLARPDTSGGAAQADFFATHGGGWSADGKTLPGTVDLEWNPYGSACYGLSPAAMVAWIRAFSDEYHARTGRWPIIYTATGWWSQCTGDKGDFAATNPLWVSRFGTTPGTLPDNWHTYTFWQYGDGEGVGLDRFNGDYARLIALATG